MARQSLIYRNPSIRFSSKSARLGMGQSYGNEDYQGPKGQKERTSFGHAGNNPAGPAGGHEDDLLVLE